MRTMTKRFSMLAATLLLAGAAGACADEPMGVEEQTYEVQMDGTSDEGNCVIIAGKLVCS